MQKNRSNDKVAIVILNWNGWEDTIECLKSLTNLNYGNFYVLVVDNASTDDSRQKLLDWGRAETALKFSRVYEKPNESGGKVNVAHKDWIYIQSTVNGGFAKGNNLGIKHALDLGCDYVWLLNNDTVVDSNALSALVTKVKIADNVGMCGSILRFFDDKNTIQAVGGVEFNFLLAGGTQLGQGLLSNDPLVAQLAKQSPTYIAGASLLVSTKFLSDVGLMEESYFLYFEEIDWAMRAKKRWETATALNSIVYHKEGGSIGTDSRGKRSLMSQYYLSRNLIRFYMLRRLFMLPFAIFHLVKEIAKLFAKQEWDLACVTFKALLHGCCWKSGKESLE